MIFPFKPPFWDATLDSGPDGPLFNYRRIWKRLLLLTYVAAIAPLLIMTFMHMAQSKTALRNEIMAPLTRLISNTKRTVGDFLNERKSALRFVVKDNSYEQITDAERLGRIFISLKESFSGVIDLGVIDADGVQRAYIGPHGLEGRNYHDQKWFVETMTRGEYVSEVFRGYRDIPHFVIALKHQRSDGRDFILRATIDTRRFNELIASIDIRPQTDAFVIDHQGIIQTPSLYHGDVLEKLDLPVPPHSDHSEVLDVSADGESWKIMGYCYIPDSPFIFLTIKEPRSLMQGWIDLRDTLIAILLAFVALILVVNFHVVTFLINGVYQADMRRFAAIHRMEYTEKMASIGRLAAGVAHEINNPLAIINERAGLIKDLLTFTQEYQNDTRLMGLVDSIIGSVERCSRITHRLLGFARHVDVRVESVSIANVIREVLGFLEKEAEYREIRVTMTTASDIPDIQSDRGQLQQIFLNIINNAFASVDKGGMIDISMAMDGPETVKAVIRDNGCGIAPENLKLIFEPFFSTKTNAGGTGLGLSITYGLVKKLGGSIAVSSKVGEGTEFTVILPAKA